MIARISLLIVWLVATFIVLRFFVPVMISSRDSLTVVIGFTVALTWICASAYYLYLTYQKVQHK